MPTTKRDFNQTDLDEFFIIDTEDSNSFLHRIKGGYYKWKDGLEGAEIFTREEIKELLNDPENNELEVNVVAVKDAFEIAGKNPDDYNISDEQ